MAGDEWCGRKIENNTYASGPTKPMEPLTRKRGHGRPLLSAIGLAALAIVVAACGTGANHHPSPGAALHATQANDNHATGAALHASGGCSRGKSCYRYFRYRKVGTDGWLRTSVVGPIPGGDANVDLHQTVGGLQYDTSYEYQVCGAAKAQHYACVGPDGTTTTAQTFRTAIWTADASQSIDQEWSGYATGANCAVVTNGQPDPWVFQTKDRTSPKGLVYRAVISQTGERPCYCESSAACRSEVAQGLPTKTLSDGIDRTFNSGDDRWISLMVKLDPNYPTNPTGAGWNLWMQLKQLGGGISPTWAAGVMNGQWYLAQSMNNSTAPGGVTHPVGLARTGVWVKWTMHVIFNSDPSKGAITAWSDLADPGGSMQEVFKEDPTFTLRVGYGAHVRLGVYRDPTVAGSTGVEYAGFTVASDRATSEGNAFSP